MRHRFDRLVVPIAILTLVLWLPSCGKDDDPVGPDEEGLRPGTLVLDVTPDAIAAPWTVTGPAGCATSGTGDTTLQDLDPGTYEVCWQPVAGHESPVPACENAEVNSAGTTTVTATYTEIIVPPAPEGFVTIPAGTFVMGSPTTEPQRLSNETQHTVTLTGGFYMSKYEVTEQWWADVMGEAPTTSLLPKREVSWDIVVQFCNALSQREGLTPAYTIHGPNGNVTWNRDANGYRLPTEAEWEYACRAGTTTAFNNGTNCLSADTEANYYGKSPLTGCPSGLFRLIPVEVGSFPANAWGLYDMHGNVWEWVWDGYRSDYQNLSPEDPVHDVGADSPRVFRGGDWGSGAQSCRSAVRGAYHPDSSYNDHGFRPVRSAF